MERREGGREGELEWQVGGWEGERDREGRAPQDVMHQRQFPETVQGPCRRGKSPNTSLMYISSCCKLGSQVPAKCCHVYIMVKRDAHKDGVHVEALCTFFSNVS